MEKGLGIEENKTSREEKTLLRAYGIQKRVNKTELSDLYSTLPTHCAKASAANFCINLIRETMM